MDAVSDISDLLKQAKENGHNMSSFIDTIDTRCAVCIECGAEIVLVIDWNSNKWYLAVNDTANQCTN
jgi:hypothetical protein